MAGSSSSRSLGTGAVSTPAMRDTFVGGSAEVCGRESGMDVGGGIRIDAAKILELVAAGVVTALVIKLMK